MTGAVRSGVDLSSGFRRVTNNPLDVVPGDGGFLAVRLGEGTLGYTRDGALSVSPDGLLTSGGNVLVDGEGGGAIPVPADAEIQVASNGDVLADGEFMGRLTVAKLTGNVDRLTSSVYAPRDGTAEVVGSPSIAVGELEMSNAPPVASLVELMTAQRAYDMSVITAMETYRKISPKAAEIGRIR